MAEVQTCPRRMSETGPWEHGEGLDMWHEDSRDPEEPVRPKLGPRCSFCGSLHPDRFLDLTTKGWVVEPSTDAYLTHLSLLLDRPRSDVDPGTPLSVALLGGRVEFYFQHLSDGQMQQFADLYHGNTMRLSQPGYFSPMPFFMAAGQTVDAA